MKFKFGHTCRLKYSINAGTSFNHLQKAKLQINKHALISQTETESDPN